MDLYRNGEGEILLGINKIVMCKCGNKMNRSICGIKGLKVYHCDCGEYYTESNQNVAAAAMQALKNMLEANGVDSDSLFPE